MKLKKVITSLSLIVMIGVCGCGMGKEETDEELTELTEQQIEILEQEGMPTDINQLSELQKYDIQKIDEMMNYMEETYGEEFVFDGYHEPELLDRWEKLYVYRAVDTDKTSLITVKRKRDDGEWFYEDGYLRAYADSYWKELIKDYINEFLQDEQFIIECYSRLKEDATVENIRKDFKKYSYGRVYIYIDGGVISETKYEEIKKDLKVFVKKEELEEVSMYLLKKGVLPHRKKLKLHASADENNTAEKYISIDNLL